MLKILSFQLAGELFGVEITKVKEINRNIEYSLVPRSPKNVIGLFNMRGQIVTLFNVAAILGYEHELQKGRVTCIILKSEPGSPNQSGFVIDNSGDVIDVEEEMCGIPPANVDDFECKHVKAVVKLENDLLRIIEMDELFSDTN